MVAVVLTFAWPVAIAGAAEFPGEGDQVTDVQLDALPEVPPLGENEGALPDRPQPTPTSSTAANSMHQRLDPAAPNRIVFHAATPLQLCKAEGGLQLYFLRSDGSSHTGPWLAPFTELAATHLSGAPVSLYNGANPFTGKSIRIDYLPVEQKIRVSTYYPDTEYDTNKPYLFTVDSDNKVTHEAW